MKPQVYLRPVRPLTPEQTTLFNMHCKLIGALPVPEGVDVLVPEHDRARETSRRQSAVELLLSDGYTWVDGKWKRPLHMLPLTEQLQQKCVDWNAYWRASDGHGVKLSVAQAMELLRDALGVEVAIDLDMFYPLVTYWMDAWQTEFSRLGYNNPEKEQQVRADYEHLLKIIKEARG